MWHDTSTLLKWQLFLECRERFFIGIWNVYSSSFHFDACYMCYLWILSFQTFVLQEEGTQWWWCAYSRFIWTQPWLNSIPRNPDLNLSYWLAWQPNLWRIVVLTSEFGLLHNYLHYIPWNFISFHCFYRLTFYLAKKIMGWKTRHIVKQSIQQMQNTKNSKHDKQKC